MIIYMSLLGRSLKSSITKSTNHWLTHSFWYIKVDFVQYMKFDCLFHSFVCTFFAFSDWLFLLFLPVLLLPSFVFSDEYYWIYEPKLNPNPGFWNSKNINNWPIRLNLTNFWLVFTISSNGQVSSGHFKTNTFQFWWTT